MLPSRDVGMDNANEECCLEGCNTEEILEYACWNCEMRNFSWREWEKYEKFEMKKMRKTWKTLDEENEKNMEKFRWRIWEKYG